MSIRVLNIIGSGGHAKVVVEALSLLKVQPKSVLVRDDSSAHVDAGFLGYQVEVPAVADSFCGEFVHVAIGHCLTRERIYQATALAGGKTLTIQHPAACVSTSADISPGSFIAALSIIAPFSFIGIGTIVNHGAVVDHDCHVGSYSHVAPNSTLCGGVSLGRRVLVGAGATILPGVQVGDDVRIGAGVVVKHDVKAGCTIRV